MEEPADDRDVSGDVHPAGPINPAAAGGSRIEPRSRGIGCLFEIVQTVVLTFVIFLGVQTFVAQPFKVEGGSMTTTLLSGQYVLIDKLSPHWAPYARGDIVVLQPPPASPSEMGCRSSSA